MNIRELYTLIEMLPEAGLEYIVNRMTGSTQLTKDEINLLTDWISKRTTVERPAIIRQILLTLDYKNIQYIENPSEEEQYKAVCHEPMLIQYIDDPSENVQMAAVQGHTASKIFNVLKNPSEAIFLALIKETPSKIIGMQNPSEIQQVAAISRQAGLITNTSIKWCYQAERKAFEIEKDLFQYVTDPTEEECWIALQHNARNLQYIKNPTDEMKSFAIIVS